MPQQPPSPRSSARENFLTLMLLTLVAGGFFVFFVGIMGMFIIHALVIFALLACFGCFHYFLWGRSMSQDVRPARPGRGVTAPGRLSTIQLCVSSRVRKFSDRYGPYSNRASLVQAP